MNRKKMIKQMLDFNKNAFENTFNIMATLQDQTQSNAQKCLEQASWLPGEGKKAIDEWMETCKQGRDYFKNAMEEGFIKAEEILADSSEESS